MELRPTNYEIQNAHAQVDIAMLKKTIYCIENKIQSQHLVCYSQQDEWQNIEQVLNGLLNWMKSINVQPVEFMGRVMYSVQLPEWFPVVA